MSVWTISNWDNLPPPYPVERLNGSSSVENYQSGATGQTLYIPDEPSTGLHFEDVRKLLEVVQRLVDQGNTVVMIEHNLDIVRTADWVIDIGPEGGDAGGQLVASGTPEAVPN